MLKRLTKRFCNNKGFSLIELISIIAILSMLTAIVIPSAAGYISASKTATANTNARTVYTAAAAAVSACAASGTINSVSDILSKDVAELKLGSEFEKQLADTLGDTFKGKITVHISSDYIVSSAEWEDNNIKGSYLT